MEEPIFTIFSHIIDMDIVELNYGYVQLLWLGVYKKETVKNGRFECCNDL